MSKIELKGRVIEIQEPKQLTEKFIKGSIIIETFDEYPNYLTLDFTNKNTEKMKYIKVGDNVDASAFIKGRKYQKDGKTSYFLSLDCVFIKAEKQDNPTPNNTEPKIENYIPQVKEDDLPF